MKPFKALFSGVILTILFSMTSMLVAQNPSQIDVLTTEQGLPFRGIKSIVQDSKGLLWFGTSQGIVRYDGYNFKNYNSDRKNPFYIEEELITGELVLDDTEDKLWYMANDRLFTLELATDKVVEYTVINNIKGKVLRLLKTPDGTIWAITDDYWRTQADDSRQFLQKYVNGNFEVIASIPRINRGFCRLTSDLKGHLWWSTPNGTYQYSQQGELLGFYTLGTYNWFGSTMHFIVSFFDNKNTHYYFPHEGGIRVFNEADQSSKRVLDNQNEIFHAIEDYKNHKWFAGNHVLYKMDPHGNFLDYTQLLKQRLDYSTINELFIDNNNLLWVATDNGLFKIHLAEQVFDTLFKSNKEGWGNTMRGFFEDAKGTVYVLCENQNKIVYRTRSGVLDTLRLTPDIYNHSELEYAANFFVLDNTKENVFTAAISLLKINLNTGNVRSFDRFKHKLKVYGTNPLLKLRDGRLLFGYTFSRLTLFDPKTETSEAVFKRSDSTPEIANMRFFKESLDDNVVWIGTQNNGLYKVSMTGTILKTYQVNTSPSIAKNSILTLETNKDGGLWVGTYGGGLNYISADGENVKSYTTAQGLPDNNVVGILIDEKNNLWISTYNGLSYFDIENQSFQNFYAVDGLSHNEFNYASFFKDTQGTYYFGGMNGVTLFEPVKVLSTTEAPALEFLSFSGYNNKRKESFFVDLSQLEKKVLEVSPYDQYFQVSWTMPSFFNNQKNTYSTKLEGYEERWFYQGNTASIRYNQLPAGNYELKIKGADSRGNASATILSIPVQVRQIFYKQWWFIGLLILFAMGMTYAIFRYRLKHALSMERLRTKISSDLHDEVGSLLSGLAMQTELMEMNATEADKFKLQKIAAISRNAVSQMRDLVWSIDSRRETVNDLLERMQELAEELLLPKEVSFEINSSEVQNPNRKLTAQFKQSVFLIYKEAITNILKHSDATHVVISLSNHGKGCRLFIKDNGGLKSSYKSTGMGLANMVLRAKKIKGVISFSKENGFAVLVDIPFHL